MCKFPKILICLILLISSCTNENKKHESELAIIDQQVRYNIEQSEVFTYLDGEEITDEEGKLLSMKKLVGTGNDKLVFRFTSYNCIECIISELTYLNKYIESMGKDRLIMLGSFENINQLRIFKKKYNISFMVYNINNKNDCFPSSLTEMNMPFYFNIDKELTSSRIFIPEKELGKYSSLYIESIVKQQKNQDNEGVVFVKRDLKIPNGEMGKLQHYTFTFNNKMSVPLVIENVVSPCDCTVAFFDRGPIAPGAASHIKVQYTPSGKGNYFKKILFKSNAKNSKILLTISGEIS